MELAGLDAQSLIARPPQFPIVTRERRDDWIRGVLSIRGIKVDNVMVRKILEGNRDPRCSRQERVFIGGLDRALDRLLARGAKGELPDGWFTIELFETVTQGLPRFTNNHLRRDLPWDSLRHLRYPKPSEIGGMLDRFTEEHRYCDMPLVFDRMHPVRCAFRGMWRLGRISPFPDFNLMFAFIFMNAFHVAHGYPLIVPAVSDKQMLENLVTGPVPQRLVQFESRLLEAALAA